MVCKDSTVVTGIRGLLTKLHHHLCVPDTGCEAKLQGLQHLLRPRHQAVHEFVVDHWYLRGLQRLRLEQLRNRLACAMTRDTQYPHVDTRGWKLLRKSSSFLLPRHTSPQLHP